MSKPWDKLRVPCKPRLRAGEFLVHKETVVRWHEETSDDGTLGASVFVDDYELGGGDDLLGPATLRCLGEFLIELADQLEPQ